MMNCGIYCIKNLINNKIYIGKTNDLQSRWKNHLFVLRANTHSNKHLQTAFNKYGESNFEFIILLSFDYFDNDKLNQLEIQYIQEYKSYINTFGYNKTLGGDGRSHTEESKLLIKKQRSIPILQYDLEMNFIKEWGSMREACRQVLELAAENARLTEKMSIPEDDLESIDVTTREAPDMTYIVGKQSILDTIKQIE